jgi:hypothetical protein
MYCLNGPLAYNIALSFTITKLNNVYIKDMLRLVNIASLYISFLSLHHWRHLDGFHGILRTIWRQWNIFLYNVFWTLSLIFRIYSKYTLVINIYFFSSNRDISTKFIFHSQNVSKPTYYLKSYKHKVGIREPYRIGFILQIITSSTAYSMAKNDGTLIC